MYIFARPHLALNASLTYKSYSIYIYVFRLFAMPHLALKIRKQFMNR